MTVLEKVILSVTFALALLGVIYGLISLKLLNKHNTELDKIKNALNKEE